MKKPKRIKTGVKISTFEFRNLSDMVMTKNNAFGGEKQNENEQR